MSNRKFGLPKPKNNYVCPFCTVDIHGPNELAAIDQHLRRFVTSDGQSQPACLDYCGYRLLELYNLTSVQRNVYID